MRSTLAKRVRSVMLAGVTATPSTRRSVLSCSPDSAALTWTGPGRTRSEPCSHKTSAFLFAPFAGREAGGEISSRYDRHPLFGVTEGVRSSVI